MSVIGCYEFRFELDIRLGPWCLIWYAKEVSNRVGPRYFAMSDQHLRAMRRHLETI